MGKIFGISDLPVSTIMSVFEPVEVPKPQESRGLETAMQKAKKVGEQLDTVVLPRTAKKTKSVIGMRFGFGKLMKHFSKRI